jgi:choline-sulfatase
MGFFIFDREGDMSDCPNILVLHSDEHSFRFLSAHSRERGGEPCQTPTLDGLIAKGVNFDAAYCQMPLCTPSRISMLTGRHSHKCGAWGNASVLPPELPTFGSHFQANGYATAVVGKMHLGGSRQFAGFGARPYGDFGGSCAHQHDPLSVTTEDHLGGSEMRSRTVDAGVTEIPESFLQENRVARESLSWVREHRHANPDQPWLLYASFSRPHFPLTSPKRFFDRYYPEGVTPPRIGRTGDSANHPMTVGAIKGFRTEEIDEAEAMKARAGYFAAVDFFDEMLGDFLALLDRDGLLDNTVIVYTSDHGELAGEHGIWWKNTWHESATHVPFIVSLPEHRRGELAVQEVMTPMSLADLFPTLCGLAGVDEPDGLDGVDLTPVLKGDACEALENRVGVITEATAPRWGKGTEFRMIRSKKYKYVMFRDCEDLAFDLENDPDEQHNLLKDDPDQAELVALREALLDGFDFDAVEALRAKQSAELKAKYPARVEMRTPNQIWLGTGQLVDADDPLYYPNVISENGARDFEDFPK